MSSLRIVHALPFFDPATRFGGPIAQLRRVCRGLAERGHDVRVVASDLGIGPDLPRDEWVERDGYRVWYGRVGASGQFAPYRMRGVRPALEDALGDADVLHLSLSFTHMNIMARRVARRHGVPYVYAPRSCLDPVRLRHRRLAKFAFLRLYERRILRDAAAVHVLTDVEREHVMRQGATPEQCVRIPNAAEFDEHTEWPPPRAFRRQLGLPADARIVLFMGRLHYLKGLDLLVDAFAKVHRAGCSSTHLVVAGPDEGARADVLRRARRRRVRNAVHVVGRLDGQSRRAAYRAADVFALTSHSEGMSNAILEACAAATPVLITDQCHLPEVADYEAGRVVPPSTGAVAKALWEMLGDPARLRLMGANGQRMIAEGFSLPVVLDRLEALYTRVAPDRPSLDAPSVHAAPDDPHEQPGDA